ncbi:MAG: hypothetical protein ACR2NV_03455 [Thermoleophilaceae bacterium]
MNTLTEASLTNRRVDVSLESTEYAGSHPERRVPLTIPSAQEYYWHFSWQQGEREAVADLEAGRSTSFDGNDPEAVIRWLHETEDDEGDADAS